LIVHPERAVPYLRVNERIALHTTGRSAQHRKNKRRSRGVKLSQYRAMCNLMKDFDALRRLREAVREAEADAESSPAKLAKKLRKKRNAARLKGFKQRQRAARRRR
jgi:hypothetical protein